MKIQWNIEKKNTHTHSLMWTHLQRDTQTYVHTYSKQASGLSINVSNCDWNCSIWCFTTKMPPAEKKTNTKTLNLIIISSSIRSICNYICYDCLSSLPSFVFLSLLSIYHSFFFLLFSLSTYVLFGWDFAHMYFIMVVLCVWSMVLIFFLKK